MTTQSTETQQFDVFLSHNSREKSAVEALAYKLRAAELNPWLDKEQLIPGARWQGGLAAGLQASSTCAVFIGKDDLGNWESEELDVAQNRAANDHDFRIIPVLLPNLPDPFDPSPLPPFLLSRTWVDFRPGLDDARAFNRLVCAIKGIPPGPEDGGPLATTDNTKTEIVPYLGLDTFDEADAGLFFGREADVQRLVEKLKAARFLAVIGASGSGKSSLARAGLVPALRRDALPGSGEWMMRVFRPGARPLAELALQLVQLRGEALLPSALTEMEQELRKDERALHNAVRLKLASLQLKPEEEAQRRVLLVVDQFEEVFTLCHDDEERARFLDNLLYASAALDGRSVVVLTMRADFYYKCAVHGGLSARIAAHQYLVGPMTEENLRQAIEEPARLAGLKVEPELLAEVLTEVGHQPGTLPLLEYALLEVWKRRREGRLTLKGYRESGGVKEALSKRAETIYEALSASQQEIAQRVMLRLTQPGEGTDDTRRRARMSELATRNDEREAVAEVVDTLTDARLLTTSKDEQTQDQVVDVSHEALIRGWPRLRQWVEEDRAGLRTLLRLNEAAQEWQRENRDEGLLYRGARLAAALESRARYERRLNELEREFLAASDALKLREEEEREATQRRELETAQKLVETEKQRAETEKRSSARLRHFLVGLAILLIASIIATFVAYKQRQQALAESKKNLEFLYVADMRAAFQVSEIGNAAEVRRLLEAHQPSAGTDSHRFEWLWLWRLYHNEKAELKGHIFATSSVAFSPFSPDGKMLASASDNGTVKLWDAQTYQEIGTLRGHTDMVSSVAFSPDGKMLASASDDGTVKLWDAQTRQELATLKEHGVEPNKRQHAGSVFSIAFSPDGKMLASANNDGTVKLWDVQTGKELATLKGHTSLVGSVAFSPDGKMLASASDDYTVKLWDAQTRRELVTLRGHTALVDSVAFSPDGKMLASASDDGTVKLWDAQTKQELATLKGHASSVFSIAFSPDGKILASGSGDKTVKLWDAQTRRELVTLKGHTDIVDSVAFSPDGKTLVSGSYDGTLKLWDAQTRQEPATLKGHTNSVKSVAFSPDGRTLASGSEDKTVKLWNAQSGQELAMLKGHASSVFSVAFSPDGKILASGSADKTVKLWDAQTGKELATLKGHTGTVLSVALSPDGKTLASASDMNFGVEVGPGSDFETVMRGAVKLWDVSTRRELATLKGHTKEVTSVAFSPDGKTLATGSRDQTVKLWDAQTGKELATLKGHTSTVLSVALSPDGKILVEPF